MSQTPFPVLHSSLQVRKSRRTQARSSGESVYPIPKSAGELRASSSLTQIGDEYYKRTKALLYLIMHQPLWTSLFNSHNDGSKQVPSAAPFYRG